MRDLKQWSLRRLGDLSRYASRTQLFKIMSKRCPLILLTLISLLFAGCFGSSSSALSPIQSPDGNLILIPSVNRAKSDLTKHLCINFKINDGSGSTLHEIQTGASDIQKWAIAWFDDSTIVLYSSDIGTYAWKLDGDGQISEIPHPIPADLKSFGDRIKSRKY